MDDDETDDDSSLEVDWDDTRGNSCFDSILSTLLTETRLVKFTKVLKKKEERHPNFMKDLFTSMFS